jgi:hypothetical protein
MQASQFIGAWNRAPLMTRVTVLARLVVNGERGDVAVMKLIELCGLMASMLSVRARLQIAMQLRDTADCLAPPFDQRLN